jgi:hypothetical protein
MSNPTKAALEALRKDCNELADDLDAIRRRNGIAPLRCGRPGCRGGLWREGEFRVCTKCGGKERA